MSASLSSLTVYAGAAFAEIAGCFAFWAWLRKGGTPLVALLGGLSLIAFGALVIPGFAPRQQP